MGLSTLQLSQYILHPIAEGSNSRISILTLPSYSEQNLRTDSFNENELNNNGKFDDNDQLLTPQKATYSVKELSQSFNKQHKSSLVNTKQSTSISSQQDSQYYSSNLLQNQAQSQETLSYPPRTTGTTSSNNFISPFDEDHIQSSQKIESSLSQLQQPQQQQKNQLINQQEFSEQQSQQQSNDLKKKQKKKKHKKNVNNNNNNLNLKNSNNLPVLQSQQLSTNHHYQQQLEETTQDHLLLNSPINSLLPLSSSRSNSSVNTSSSTTKGQNSPRNIEYSQITNPQQKCTKKGQRQLLEEYDGLSIPSNEDKKSFTAAKTTNNKYISSPSFNLFSFPLLNPQGQQLNNYLDEFAQNSFKKQMNVSAKLEHFGTELNPKVSTIIEQKQSQFKPEQIQAALDHSKPNSSYTLSEQQPHRISSLDHISDPIPTQGKDTKGSFNNKKTTNNLFEPQLSSKLSQLSTQQSFTNYQSDHTDIDPQDSLDNIQGYFSKPQQQQPQQLHLTAQFPSPSAQPSLKRFLPLIIKQIINHETSYGHDKTCFSLYNEFILQCSLQHPHILCPLQLQLVQGNHSGECYIISEKAQSDLFDLYLSSEAMKKPADLSEMRIMMRQISSALAYIHDEKDIVHCDIKPENIFKLSPNNFVLADFGLARTVPSARRQQEQLVCLHCNPHLLPAALCQTSSEFRNNHPQINQQLPPLSLCDQFSFKTRQSDYFSPEIVVFQTHHDIQALEVIEDKKSDVFALGMTLFVCIFKLYPYMQKCSTDDPLYRYLAQKDKKTREGFWKRFWQPLEFYANNFDDSRVHELIDLLEKMLNPYPSERLSASQVLAHPWLQQSII